MAKTTAPAAKNSKEIIALSPYEAVRLRPTMYIGQVSLMDEKLPIIIDGKLKSVEKKWSAGFMHLIVEVLENAIDEAKRCKGKMENIYVSINLDDNRVIIRDEGTGFHNAHEIHHKTKKNVVRTALEELHAGSNFLDTDINILGTHGVGAAVTNILSEEFTVETTNDTHYVTYTWKDFKIVDEEIRPRKKGDTIGTIIDFVPSKEIFPKYKWDQDLIVTYLSYKSFLIKTDPVIKNLKIVGTFVKGGKEYAIPIVNDFIPQDHVKVETNYGSIYMWPSYPDSTSLSFVNGSQCTGIHQKIVNDWCNEYFKYNLAHHFYETLITLNVPSKIMRFADQNKTKFATSRGELEDDMFKSFNKRLISLLAKSDIARVIENSIEDRLHNENLVKIKRAQKQSKRRISDKYSAPTRTKGSIFLTEGLSAAGGVKQARDSESEAVYALKGKVKNSKKLSDLTSNKELLEIMSILDIEPNNSRMPGFGKIIIASDSDADGAHITSLIINFFYSWFPHVIDDGRLYQLITPLVVCDSEKERKYFYSLDEFSAYAKANRVTNVNYLKGLGSLSLDDWRYVMDNKVLFKITNDRSSKRYLEIAFGASSNKRKKWLQS
jgi:topoisomerase-4 subunit B